MLAVALGEGLVHLSIFVDVVRRERMKPLEHLSICAVFIYRACLSTKQRGRHPKDNAAVGTCPKIIVVRKYSLFLEAERFQTFQSKVLASTFNLLQVQCEVDHPNDESI